MFGLNTYIPETKTYSTGTRQIITLTDLPRGQRIKNIILRLKLTIVAGAGNTGVSSQEITRAVESIKVGKRVRLTGIMTSYLDWFMSGKDVNFPAAIASGASTVTRYVDYVLPFSDPSAFVPDDTAPNTEFFTDTPVEIQFASLSGAFGANGANLTVTGQVRTLVCMEPADKNVIPSPIVVNYDDWNQKTVYLPNGVYSHLFLFKEDGAALTEAELGSISLWNDGKKIYDDITAGELALLFNYYAAKGVTNGTVTAQGEGLPEDDNFPFVPVISPGRAYKLTKLHNPLKNIRLDISGSLTALRVGYRMIEPTSPAMVAKASRRLGINISGKKLFAKTGSKNVLPAGRAFGVLPKKWVNSR